MTSEVTSADPWTFEFEDGEYVVCGPTAQTTAGPAQERFSLGTEAEADTLCQILNLKTGAITRLQARNVALGSGASNVISENERLTDLLTRAGG